MPRHAGAGRANVQRLRRRAFVAVLLVLHFFQSPKPSPPPSSSSSSSIHTPTYFEPTDPIRVYSPSNSASNVAICLIVKNETVYLDEWVDYHVALGFAPIYIYDNSIYPDWELAAWYERREDVHEYVRIVHFPQAPIQKAAYDRCLRQDVRNSTFAGLFDVDEFLVLKEHDNVVDFAEQHCNEGCGQLGINWRVMSSSLETQYKSEPVTKRFMHWTNLTFQDVNVKVLVRPNYIVDDDMDWTHTVRLKRGNWIDTDGTVIPRPDKVSHQYWREKQTHHGPTNVALFHHYRWKSAEEYDWKTCHRGTALTGRTVRCKGRMEKIGMENTPEGCGEWDKWAKLLWQRNVSKCGVFDDAAWRQLQRTVPRYARWERRGADT